MLFSTDALNLRDPFVVVDEASRCYYLYATHLGRSSGPLATAHEMYCYVSRDLARWDGPHPAFRPPADFWATQDFWAPEVHAFRGKWYLFLSLKAEGRCRGTQVLVADSPRGPFAPLPGGLQGPTTPADWDCLDGTLFVKDGKPWMVFCHEWAQIVDGTICAMPLKDDLSASAGKPIELFRAREAPWVRPAGHCLVNGKPAYVTDAPWFHRLPGGDLLMLWSSFGEGGYATGTVRSRSGKLAGPWDHDPLPLFDRDGGHSMIFRALDGQLTLALHQPNRPPHERAQFFPLAVTRSGGRETLAIA